MVILKLPAPVPSVRDNVLPFPDIHRDEARCLELLERCFALLQGAGYALAPDGTLYIRQGFKPTPQITGSIDLNRFHAFIDHRLVEEGWIPFAERGIDDHYFSKGKQLLDVVGWKEIREERSSYRLGGFPAMVFYGRDK